MHSFAGLSPLSHTLYPNSNSAFKYPPYSPLSFSSSPFDFCSLLYLHSSAPRSRDLQFSASISQKTKMNHYGIHQKNTFASSPEDMMRSVSVSVISDNKGAPMVCPKPRRLSLFSATVNEPVRPLRWQMCHPSEGHDSAAGLELLDTIFAKCGGYGGYGPTDQMCTQLASSPPFFSGSPPSRVSNPLIQDTRFGDDKVCPVSPRLMIPNPASTSSPGAGGFHRSSFGNKPEVRIEGFDCLDRDNRRSCSILTRA